MTIPILSIHDIDTSSGRVCLDNQLHVTTTDELHTPQPTGPRKGDHFVIMLAVAGTTPIKYNLLDYTLKPNDMFIISPAVIHQFDARNGILIGAGFTKEFFSEALIHKKHINVFDFLLSNKDPYYPLSPNEAGILHQLMLMVKNYYYDRGQPLQKQSLFHSFNLFILEAAKIFQKYRLDTDSKSTRKNEILAGFLQLLSEHYKKERSVQFYADRIFVSPQHLTKILKESTGKTAGQLIDEMVVAEAKILLDFPELTVGSIAEELNFSSQFIFSKFFKRHTGFSPSHFRSQKI